MSNIDTYLKKRAIEKQKLDAEAKDRTFIAQGVLEKYIEQHVKKSVLMKDHGVTYEFKSGVHILKRAGNTFDITAASDGIRLAGKGYSSTIRIPAAESGPIEKLYTNITKQLFELLLPKDVFQ
jgi:hypothetical protein